MVEDQDETLEYMAPPAKPRGFRAHWTAFGLWGLLLLGGLAALAIFNRIRALYGVLLLAIIPIMAWKRLLQKRQSANPEGDVQTAMRQDVEEELELARRIYATAPLGSWGVVHAQRSRRGVKVAKMKRRIVLREDGTGQFESLDLLTQSACQVIFNFKAEGKSAILVQVTSPAVEGWHLVTFDFEVDPAANRLILEFGGINPMPLEFGECWPFRGSYIRQGA